MKGRTLATMVLVLLVVVWFGINEASAECTIGPPVRNGYRGRNVIKKTQTVSILRCFRMCKGDKDCTAINYNEQTKYCDLLEGNELLIYPNDKFTFVGYGTVVKVGSDKVVSCPIAIKPKELAKASVSVNQNRTIATYTCRDSYAHTSGKTKVQCRYLSATAASKAEEAYREWETPTIECKVICPTGVEPNQLARAHVEVNPDRTIASYTCKAPYRSSLTTVQCVEVEGSEGSSQPSRVWEAAAIVCEVACPKDVKPKQVAGATVTVNAGRTIATYQCLLPYEKTSGSTTVQCEGVASAGTGEVFLEWENATIVCADTWIGEGNY